jgi:hypothetical protein
MMRIVQGDFNDPRIVELLQCHLTSARAQTAAGSAHESPLFIGPGYLGWSRAHLHRTRYPVTGSGSIEDKTQSGI